MEIILPTSYTVSVGDLVYAQTEKGKTTLCLITFDEEEEYRWVLIRVKTMKIFKKYKTAHDLTEECRIATKSNKVKLIVEE